MGPIWGLRFIAPVFEASYRRSTIFLVGPAAGLVSQLVDLDSAGVSVVVDWAASGSFSIVSGRLESVRVSVLVDLADSGGGVSFVVELSKNRY